MAATATGVILDAYVTEQIASEEPGVGVYTGVTDLPSAGNMLMGSLVGRGRRPRREQLADDLGQELAGAQISEDGPVNLVAVDLLWLDGGWLLDAPLLERKRLLEAVLPATRSCARACTCARPSSAGWARGAPRASAASRSRARTRAIDPGKWPRTGSPARCPALSEGLARRRACKAP